ERNTAERDGLIALVLASHAHSELEMGNTEYAAARIVECTNLLNKLPNVARGIRWRAEQLVKAFQSRHRGQESINRESIDGDTLVWAYIKSPYFPLVSISDPNEFLLHANAYRTAKRLREAVEFDDGECDLAKAVTDILEQRK